MIYFIPGVGETKKDYKPFFTALKKHNIKFLNLHIDDILNLSSLQKRDTLIGFSIGAVVAYMIAYRSDITLEHLILCSPTPIIVRANEPHAKKVDILVGKKDHPIVKARSKILAKKWKTKMIIVDAGHDINKPAYIRKIQEILPTK